MKTKKQERDNYQPVPFPFLWGFLFSWLELPPYPLPTPTALPIFMVGRETNGCFLHAKEAGALCHDPF